MIYFKFKLAIASLAVITQFAHAEVTAIQQEVLDNYMAMKNYVYTGTKKFPC